jgi:integrase
MDTGGRASSEIMHLKFSDIDRENCTVKITNKKTSQTRIIPVSAKTVEMINALPKQPEDYLFSQSFDSLRRKVENTKKKLAKTLQNPRLNRITFHSIHYWKGLKEYRKTRDILHIQRLLCMRSVKNTLRYITLIDIEKSDETPDISLKCPNCGLGPDNLLKDGLWKSGDDSRKQRWRCSSCGKRFTTDIQGGNN